MVNSLNNNTEQVKLSTYVEQAYLDYAMYVILDRALPHLGDGLKPVQRRIIFAMAELNLDAGAKHKKSARTIGDVLGKYHPHGDTACYEAMVLMAQPFSLRYPLIDGQGNFGSTDDPKSFAAMRYTEARLTKFSEILLNEINQGTVTWGKNFDGSLEEPLVLPAELPHILLNGTTGIAVGMATDIPPHNVHEVCSALLFLLDNPQASLQEITSLILAPDYPTGAEIITPQTEITNIYATGSGSIRVRATYIIEDGNIIVTALPFLASGSHILEQIAQEMQAKKITLISDLRDESDHDTPTRLVIVPKSNRVDKDELMLHLFNATDLEKTFRVNLNVIGLDGKPQVKPLKDLLLEWLCFRSATVTKRLQHRQQIIAVRLHILEGFLIAYKNIDELIHIIRTHDNPEKEIQKTYKLSTEQTRAVLELKLKSLAKLEEKKIITEASSLQKEAASLEAILNSKSKLKALIKTEIATLMKKFTDPRRSMLVTRAAAKTIETIPSIEQITVILSEKGWIRAGKGHDINLSELSFKAGDKYLTHACGNSNEPIIIFDSTGNAYTLTAEDLPSLRGLGEPVTTKVTPPPNSVFTHLTMGDPSSNILLCSDKGYAFYTTLQNLCTRNRKGKAIIKLPASSLLPIAKSLTPFNELFLAIFTKNKELLVIKGDMIPTLNKGKGKKIIAMTKSNLIVDIKLLKETDPLVVSYKNKDLTMPPKTWKQYLATDLKPRKYV